MSSKLQSPEFFAVGFHSRGLWGASLLAASGGFDLSGLQVQLAARSWAASNTHGRGASRLGLLSCESLWQMPSVAQRPDVLPRGPDLGQELRQTWQARGLENDSGSNHCFLNVVIQALWNLQSFRRRLLDAPRHRHAPAAFCSGWRQENEHCCYCALRSLFHDFAFSERDVLPPDALRRALSTAYTMQGRFQMGDMEDATETIEIILGILHACSVSSSLAPSASPRAQYVHAELVEEASHFGCQPLCLSHEVFGFLNWIWDIFLG